MDIISQFFPLILAAGVKPWALGVLVVILGLLGLVLLACCYDDKADDGAFWNSELYEGCASPSGAEQSAPRGDRNKNPPFSGRFWLFR